MYTHNTQKTEIYGHLSPQLKAIDGEVTAPQRELSLSSFVSLALPVYGHHG